MKAALLQACSSALIVLLLSALFPASAQEKQQGSGTVVIKNARIITMTGQDIPRGSILIRKGKIGAVGERVRAPRSAEVIDASGKVVLPGLIDANSALLREGAAGGNAAGDVLDLVNLYVTGQTEFALERGITSIALFPSFTAGFSGRGAVLRLVPDADLEKMTLKSDLGLKYSLGIGSYGRTISRLKEVQKFRASLKGAKEYKKSLETYDEELEEYVKKLEERAEEKKKNGEEGKKKEKKEEKKEEKKGEKGGKEEKKEELKKPKKPRRDVQKEWLVKVIEGELPLFLETHRAADILNVLDVVEEYPVRLVLVGATEGYMVADALADAGVTVVLGPVQRILNYEKNEYRNHKAWCAAALAKAGVPVVLASSGRLGTETRFLSFSAAEAVASGLCPNKALAAITVDAAKVLGIDDQVGTLEKGKDADILIMDGDPLSSSSRVEMVFIKGEIAFTRDS